MQKSCLPSLVDSQERDIPGRETVATSGPDSASNAPTVPGNPGDGFVWQAYVGCEYRDRQSLCHKQGTSKAVPYNVRVQ